MKQCLKCQSMMNDDAKFCTECGASLEKSPNTSKNGIVWIVIALITLVGVAFYCFGSGTINGQAAVQNEFRGAETEIGYVITKDIAVSLSKAPNARTDMTIRAGRICLKNTSSPNTYGFELIDEKESITIGKDYVTYEAPNQDFVPDRYAQRSIFDQSAKKVTVYKSAPSSWEIGKTVTLIPRSKNEYGGGKVTIKPVRIYCCPIKIVI